jgi:hypothetical protein
VSLHKARLPLHHNLHIPQTPRQRLRRALMKMMMKRKRKTANGAPRPGKNGRQK